LPIEERLIQRIFAYADRRVRDVMRPRNEIVALNVATSPNELLQVARDVGFSRYPVFEDNLDQPLGYVHVKDLIWAEEQDSLRPFLRPLVYIPETASLPNSFSTLTKARRHVALVLDEYGGTEGLLTLEDLLEVIVGEIEDEHSPVTELLLPRKDGTWLLEGSVPVAELEDLLGVEFSSTEAYVTLAGYLMTELGRLPEAGETLEAHGFKFTVIEIDGLRIARVRIESTQKKRTSEPHDT
jgi:CBS domain containing-hemolysin-like protein